LDPHALDQGLRLLTCAVGGGIFVNGLDELHIDAQYFLRGLHTRRRIAAEALKNVRQKRIAILIPAWKEAEVIEQMLDHNLAALDYDPENYDIFCGTYPNDHETQDKVDAVTRRARNVHKVVVPHDGPTSKADCLNWVYQGIVLEEERRGRRFEILLMHDAEDIIHPASLRLYSLLIPEHEFVQTPVFSLPLQPSKLVAATYIDEFAEHHLKDMLVRQAFGGLVPSAGVGSAFDRNAFEEIALAHGQKAFNTESLTEDYEIGLKFRLAGKRVYFACHTVVSNEPGKGPSEQFIATREYFPDGFNASIRQRSRWILGITLQTWAQIGWKGPLSVRYCLWRDRKTLFTNTLLLAAYLIVSAVAAREALAAWGGESWSFAPVVAPHSIVWWLLLFNLSTVLWRSAMKAYLVGRLYGSTHALLSVFRVVAANFISVIATARAVRQYVGHRVSGKPLRWLKTTHAFPSAAALRARWTQIGEILIQQHGLAPAALAEALRVQTRTGLPLGEVLHASGVVRHRVVVEALAHQLNMGAAELDPRRVPTSLLARLSEADAERYQVLPIDSDADGTVVLAVAGRFACRHRAEIEALLGARIRLVLADAKALDRARARAYRRLVAVENETRVPLGEKLIRSGALDEHALREALDEQAQTGEHLGELLVRKGAVSPAQLAEAFADHGCVFRRVTPDEADFAAIDGLGFGFCSLYGLVPLARVDSGAARLVASSNRVHPQVFALIGQRLGEPVEIVLAPEMDLRVALALANVNRALASDRDEHAETQPDLEPPRSGAEPPSSTRLATVGPIRYLETMKHLAPDLIARARARALGVPLHDSRTTGGPPPLGLLPESFARKHRLSVCAFEPSAMTVAAPCPTARLVREVAALFPDTPVAWQIIPHLGETHEHPSPESVRSA
jgi:adsorption protein B